MYFPVYKNTHPLFAQMVADEIANKLHVSVATIKFHLKNLYKNYNKQISLYNPSQQQLLITVVNNMLDKKLRKKPHFINFINSAILVNDRNQEYVSEWMNVVNEDIKKRSTKKLMNFFEFTGVLMKENKLYSSKSSTWMVNENEYYFSIQNDEPVVIFSKDLELSCVNS